MDTELMHKGSIRLNSGEMLRLRDVADRYLGVVRGSVWVTQEGDTRDHVVRAGEHFRFDRGGLALVWPLDDTASLVLEDGIVRENKFEPQVIAVTRNNWFAHLPELERRAHRMRAEAIGQATGQALAALANGLKSLWHQASQVLSASIYALQTARKLPSLGDSTVADNDVHRDRIDRLSKALTG